MPDYLVATRGLRGRLVWAIHHGAPPAARQAWLGSHLIQTHVLKPGEAALGSDALVERYTGTSPEDSAWQAAIDGG